MSLKFARHLAAVALILFFCSGVSAVDSTDLVGPDTLDHPHHFLTRSHDYVLVALVLTAIALLVINYYRVKSQKALRESEERFRALAERSVVGISVTQDGVFKYVNPRLAEMFGYAEHELADNRGPLDFVHPDDRTNVELSMRRRLAGDEEYSHYEARMVTKSGEVRHVEVFGSRMMYRGRPAVIATMLDITARKRTAQQLDKAHSDLAQIFNSAAPLYVINKDYTVERVNDTFCQYVGLKAEDIVGRKCYDVWLGAKCNTSDCPMRVILAGKDRLIYERELAHINGYKTIFTATAIPYLGVDGSVEGIIASFGDITEVKKREDALRESKERARAQFKSIPVPTYIWQYTDGDFILIDYNDEAFQISSGSVVNRVGKRFEDMVPDREDWKRDMARCLKEKKTIRWEEPLPYYFRGKSETLYLSVSFAYAPPNLVLVHTADVTARTRAEEALKESESRFRQLAEKAPVGIYLSQGFKILYTNPAVERIMGYNPDFIIGSDNPLDFVHPDDREHVVKWVKAFMEKDVRNARFEVRVLARGGVTRHIEIFSSPVLYQGVPTNIGTVVDITERKKAEAALAKSEEKFRLAMEATNDALWDWNIVTNKTYRNPRHATMLGYKPEELSSEQSEWVDRIHPDDRQMVLDAIETHFQKQASEINIEYRLRTKYGGYIWVLGRGKVTEYDDKGRPLRMVGTNIDITERKRAEAALQQAHQDRYDQVKQIAGGVAHEIYNSLFPASSTLDKLKERISQFEGVEAERNLKLVEIADSSVARAIEMTELVTQLSRLDSEKNVEAIDLGNLFEEILGDRSRYDAAKASIDLDIDDTATIRMARVHAYSLFSNILNNALDAIDEVEKRSIQVRAARNGGEVKVQISDTGSGIAPDILPKIFSPFFSTKPRKGTGLGLAICKRIVDIYRGEILVDSALDRGTTFTILLKT